MQDGVLNLPAPPRVFDFDGDRAEKRAAEEVERKRIEEEKRRADELHIRPGGRYLVSVKIPASMFGIEKEDAIIEVWCREQSPCETYICLKSPEWGDCKQVGIWKKREEFKAVARLEAATWDDNGIHIWGGWNSNLY